MAFGQYEYSELCQICNKMYLKYSVVYTIGMYYSARKEINLIEYFRAVCIFANYFTFIAFVFLQAQWLEMVLPVLSWKE